MSHNRSDCHNRCAPPGHIIRRAEARESPYYHKRAPGDGIRTRVHAVERERRAQEQTHRSAKQANQVSTHSHPPSVAPSSPGALDKEWGFVNDRRHGSDLHPRNPPNAHMARGIRHNAPYNHPHTPTFNTAEAQLSNPRSSAHQLPYYECAITGYTCGTRAAWDKYVERMGGPSKCKLRSTGEVKEARRHDTQHKHAVDVMGSKLTWRPHLGASTVSIRNRAPRSNAIDACGGDAC